MFKTYSCSSSLVITSRWFATSRLVVPVSVRLVYWAVVEWQHRWSPLLSIGKAGDNHEFHSRKCIWKHIKSMALCKTAATRLLMHWSYCSLVQSYRKTSSISRTKSRNLNVSCILSQLSSLHPLKPGVKLRMKMLLEQHRQAMLQLHLSYQQFYCLLRCDLY